MSFRTLARRSRLLREPQHLCKPTKHLPERHRQVIKLRRRASRKTKPVVTADNGLATTQTCTMVEIRSSWKMRRKRQPTWCTEVRCYPPSRDKAVRQMTLGTVQVADYLAWSRKQNDSGLGRRNHDLMLSSVSQTVPFP